MSKTAMETAAVSINETDRLARIVDPVFKRNGTGFDAGIDPMAAKETIEGAVFRIERS